jgi:HK97 gp10 family phage protein
MADGVSVDIQGLDAVIDKMRYISYDLRRKGGRFALRKAAKVVVDAAKQNASRLDDPVTANNISKNIAERWNGRLFKRSGDLGFRVGVLGGARQQSEAYRELGFIDGKGKDNPGGDTFYWRFIEFGAPNANVPATPFLQPALSRNVDKVAQVFISEYGKALDRAIARSIKGKKA